MNNRIQTTVKKVGWSIALLLAILCTNSSELYAQPDYCDSVSVQLEYVGPGCCWKFTFNNDQSQLPFNSVTAKVLTPGVSVTSASGGFPTSTTATSATWNFPNSLPAYSPTSVNACFNAPNNVVTVVFEWKYDGGVRCRDTVVFDCPNSPQEDCFEITEQEIECKPSPNGASYQWSFAMRSLLPCQFTQTTTVNVISPAGIAVSPSSFPVSGAWSTHSLNLSGPGATPGTVALVEIRVCCFDPSTGEERCCLDTIRVVLPECGCLELAKDTVRCEKEPGTTGHNFIYDFSARSLLPCSGVQTASVTAIAPLGVAVAPSSFPISASWSSHSLSIYGPGATPGAVVALVFEICCEDPNGIKHCCKDTIRIKLPDCPQEPQECKDCCEDFPKQVTTPIRWASSNGHAFMFAGIKAGNTKICTVSATIIDSRINGSPVYGYFYSNSYLSGTPGSGSYMHEKTWVGKDVSTGLHGLYLRMKFPPLPWWKWNDVLSYCVRIRFTDANCVTCDTVLCFTQRRYNWIFPGGLPELPPFRGEAKGDNGSQLQASGVGQLTGANSGEMNLSFPKFPSELGKMHYVGLGIETEDGVKITGASSNEYPFYVEGGKAHGVFTPGVGSSTTIKLQYSGLDGAPSLSHRVAYRFVFDENPRDTLEEFVDVLLQRDLEGGDQLEQQEKVDLSDVNTYVLHLTNSNGSGVDIERLLLQTEENVEILAVGTGSSENRSLLRFGTNDDGTTKERLTATEILGEEEGLSSGIEHGPIYLTLRGVRGTTDLNFTTFDAEGRTITEGNLVLNPPVSGVHDAGSGEDYSGVRLHQSFPNPATNSTTIQFSLDNREQNVSLVVSDATGKEIAQLLSGESLSEGEHGIWFDTSELPSGTYFYTLRTSSSNTTETLQVRR